MIWTDTADRLAPGLYAWVVTVALPLATRGASLASRLAALFAVVALASGAMLAHLAPRTARLLGIWGFVGSSVASWALYPAAVSAARLDPVQGALGSLGWGLFALSWAGDRSSPPAPPAPPAPREPRAAGEPAMRSRPVDPAPASSPSVLARTTMLGVAACATLPMLLAWWVPGLERAMFAHGAALAVAMGLVVTAMRFVDAVGTHVRPLPLAPSARVAPALTTLLALSLLLLAGAAFRLLR